MKKETSLRYATIIGFALFSLSAIISYFILYHVPYFSVPRSLFLSFIGGILLVTSLLTSVSVLFTVGSIFLVLEGLWNFCAWLLIFISYGHFEWTLPSVIASLFALIAPATLLFISIKPRLAKRCARIAAASSVISIVLNLLNLYWLSFSFAATYILKQLLFSACAILLVMTHSSFFEKKPKAVASTANQVSAAAQSASGSSSVDKLIQLKALLDAGIISQEEFNEKKKQLLGL